MMNLNVPDSGSKVNGLEQLFHPWRVHCHLLHVRDGVWGGGETGRVWSGLQVVQNAESGRWFLNGN